MKRVYGRLTLSPEMLRLRQYRTITFIRKSTVLDFPDSSNFCSHRTSRSNRNKAEHKEASQKTLNIKFDPAHTIGTTHRILTVR